MSSMKNPTAHRSDPSAASKRRFLIRMVTVLIGGMVLDGYVLGIIGPVSGRMAEDLQLEILEIVSACGTSFAFPSTTVYLESAGEMAASPTIPFRTRERKSRSG